MSETNKEEGSSIPSESEYELSDESEKEKRLNECNKRVCD